MTITKGRCGYRLKQRNREAIALEFAKNGYDVVLNARDEKELCEAVNEIEQNTQESGEHITYLAGDISQEDFCSSLIEHTI